MSARHVVAWPFVLGLLSAMACASVSSEPQVAPRRFSSVNVSVDAVTYDVPAAGLVEAVLIDRDGRRTGWTRNAVLHEINGCVSQHGSEDGIPMSSDTSGLNAEEKAQLAAMLERDSLGDHEPRLPSWHHFQISN